MVKEPIKIKGKINYFTRDWKGRKQTVGVTNGNEATKPMTTPMHPLLSNFTSLQ
jgi:hypothetical protein